MLSTLCKSLFRVFALVLLCIIYTIKQEWEYPKMCFKRIGLSSETVRCSCLPCCSSPGASASSCVPVP